jgi:preprotein translocase subunit YajC
MKLALLDAQVGGAMGGTLGGTIMLIVYIVVIMAFFYFFFSRPQKKESNRLKAMLDNLEVGDAICTTSGFYGIVIDITDDTVIVEFGNNKQCRIPMQKSAIAQVEKAGKES